MATKIAPKYRVLNGLNYLDKRREPGDIVDDIPAQSLGWLLRDGHVELVVPRKPKPPKEG